MSRGAPVNEKTPKPSDSFTRTDLKLWHLQMRDGTGRITEYDTDSNGKGAKSIVDRVRAIRKATFGAPPRRCFEVLHVRVYANLS